MDPPSSTLVPTASQLAINLIPKLEELFGPGVRAINLERLSSGACRATWSLDSVIGTRSTPLILQMIRPRASYGAPVHQQAEAMRVARAVGVPVPEVLFPRRGDSPVIEPLGQCLILERIEGETLPKRILRRPLYADARRLLARQCGTALALIHSISPTVVRDLDFRHPLERWRETLDSFAVPHPVFELAFRWLEENKPAGGVRTLLHGDFRNGNLIVGIEGLRGVIDWELIHAGDPMEDIMWMALKTWRFGGQLPVGGFGRYEELFSAYERQSGRRVARESLKWWELLNTLKWGVFCIVQTMAHLTGAERSVELAVIGRRVCEVEYDLLELLPH